METINERINYILNVNFNANVAKFSRFLGVSHTTLNNIVANKMNKPSFDSLEKIITKMPNIDANWLLTGVGNMLKSDEKSVQSNSNLQHSSQINGNVVGKDIKINSENHHQDGLIEEKERIIRELDIALKEKDQIIKDGSDAMVKKDKILAEKDELLKDNDLHIKKLTSETFKINERKDAQITELHKQIANLIEKIK
ncbi:MAG: hypothetical protein LBN95_07930 [Prevotellaceae bacterium]|jgi:hypothetical protein|nr:hypothetical protein [Prevotellaceae bacterium]